MPHGPKPIVTPSGIKAGDAYLVRPAVIGVSVSTNSQLSMLAWTSVGVVALSATLWCIAVAALRDGLPDALTMMTGLSLALIALSMPGRSSVRWRVEALTVSGPVTVYWSTDYDECLREANNLVAILFPQ